MEDVFLVAALVAGVFIWQAYRRRWRWTGFVASEKPDDDHTKTFWDWAKMLGVPLTLAITALAFNGLQSDRERSLALDAQREDLLQDYLDEMSALILDRLGR